jgi:CMP-N-acetylneuraminic acid synthetase
MADQDRTLAIIPARRGSKRRPGKNTRSLAGKPLVLWTLDVALASADIDEVLVTSDDQEVLDLARRAGVRHVIERPADLAGDDATTTDVILHSLETVATSGETSPPDVLCLLQPTSPLRTTEDIAAAFETFKRHGGRPVVSVCELGHPMAWCNTLVDGHSMANFARDIAASSQSREPWYRLNGAIYLSRRDEFENRRTFLTERTVAHVMPRLRSTDIDDALDLAVAGHVIQAAGR